MSDRIEPADLSRVVTRRLDERPSKVGAQHFTAPVGPDESVASFLDGLGDVLAVRALRGLADAVADARVAGRPVLWALGGHVIKTGLAPVLGRLIDLGAVNGLAVNGAVAIHDWEIAAVGATSEDVEQGLPDGSFGMAAETATALNGAAIEARDRGLGFGEVLGRRMNESGLPHLDKSLLARAERAGVPVTIHVALGADIVHQHPGADGAAIGAASLTDFRRLVTLVGGLGGGVWINCGSAVLLPEVFLKALTTARNLGHPVRDLSTANLDMVRHYRTEQNVLRRPVRGAGAGAGYSLVGHHEINLPLLAAAIELALGRRGNTAR